MKEFIKNNWLKVLLLLGAALLVVIMFRKCNNVDNSAIFRENDSLRAAIKMNAKLYTETLKNQEKKRVADSAARSDAERRLYSTRARLDKANSVVLDLVAKGDSLKAAFDSAAYVSNCDSLQSEASALVFSNRALVSQYDELYKRAVQADAENDSLQIRKDKLYSQLRVYSDSLSVHSVELEQDFLKAEKGRRRNQAMTRGLAGAVLVLGISLLISHK